MRRWQKLGCGSILALAAAAAVGITVARIPADPPVPYPAPAVRARAGVPNIVFVTVDDMSWDSLGIAGNPLRGISPNIDRLAVEGARFTEAWVTSPICQPSRSAWMTGRVPHHSGAAGFLPIRPGVPTLPETLRGAGWRIGILAKNTHTPPLDPRAWDYWIEPRDLAVGRDPEAFHRHTARFIADSKASGRPFFLNVNIQDPHRPFPGGKRAWWGSLLDFLSPQGEFPPDPPRFVEPDRVPVPAGLPDLPEVREELSQYYTAVHRADQSVGRVLDALREAGVDNNTIVVFASDNGMALPFGKQTLYQNGLRTQVIVRWPGKVPAGTVIGTFSPTGTDIMPTLLEAAGLSAVAEMDGRSFLGVISAPTRGASGSDVPTVGYLDRVDIALPLLPRTELAFTSRSLATADSLYIWNGWADGAKEFISEASTGLAYPAIVRAAKTDPRVRQRLAFYLRRTPEEFYDRRRDPESLHNLSANPEWRARRDAARATLAQQMERNRDPQFDAFRAFIARSP